MAKNIKIIHSRFTVDLRTPEAGNREQEWVKGFERECQKAMNHDWELFSISHDFIEADKVLRGQSLGTQVFVAVFTKPDGE